MFSFSTLGARILNLKTENENEARMLLFCCLPTYHMVSASVSTLIEAFEPNFLNFLCTWLGLGLRSCKVVVFRFKICGWGCSAKKSGFLRTKIPTPTLPQLFAICIINNTLPYAFVYSFIYTHHSMHSYINHACSAIPPLAFC